VAIEIAQVEAFLAAAHHGSFSRAAEALSVAQPSLSNRIQSLERELDEQLFERTGRGVRLTDVGRAFLPHAERALRALEEGVQELEGTREATSGRLSIGSAPAISAYVLPQVLKQYVSCYGGVEVTVRTGHSEQVLELVLRDDVQLGLVRPLFHADVHTIELHQDELILVTDPAHPFARRGSVPIQEVGEESLILFDQDSSYFNLILGVFREAGIAPRQQMHLDSIEGTKKMVEQGLGMALLPKISVERELQQGSLVAVGLEGSPPIMRQSAVIYRKTKHQSGPMSAFLCLLAERFRIELPEA
jgi:DNA-binding transcriptional LysR family regulator